MKSLGCRYLRLGKNLLVSLKALIRKKGISSIGNCQENLENFEMGPEMKNSIFYPRGKLFSARKMTRFSMQFENVEG